MLGLTVYLPIENPDCDCILVFLNNMVDDGSQLIKCQSTNNDRCLFSSCSIVSEYFTRKQKEDLEEQQKLNTPSVITPIQSSPINIPFIPPSIDFNDNDDNNNNDSPYYPDDIPIEQPKITSTIINSNNFDNDDDDENFFKQPTETILTTIQTSLLIDPDESDNQFSTPLMKRIHPDPKKHQNN